MRVIRRLPRRMNCAQGSVLRAADGTDYAGKRGERETFVQRFSQWPRADSISRMDRGSLTVAILEMELLAGG